MALETGAHKSRLAAVHVDLRLTESTASGWRTGRGRTGDASTNRVSRFTGVGGRWFYSSWTARKRPREVVLTPRARTLSFFLALTEQRGLTTSRFNPPQAITLTFFLALTKRVRGLGLGGWGL